MQGALAFSHTLQLFPLGWCHDAVLHKANLTHATLLQGCCAPAQVFLSLFPSSLHVYYQVFVLPFFQHVPFKLTICNHSSGHPS